MLYKWHIIGERIRNCRKEKGLTQEGLAEEISKKIRRPSDRQLKRQTVAGWENGKPVAKLEELTALCNIFNCEMGYLLCEDGYTHKTRSAIDIETETGLSSLAVDNLVIAAGQLESVLDPSDITYDIDAFDKDYIDPENRNYIIGSLAKIRFLNLLLESNELWEEISVCEFDYKKHLDSYNRVPGYDVEGLPLSLFAQASIEKAKISLENLFKKINGDTFDH
ncbi:MAG: helix-turn-helix domain-containing protein [Lachnospiraceae bacterium]|nr:helix-turn-helix domain-containing protein [Lachnospiraceae bacterium]